MDTINYFSLLPFRCDEIHKHQCGRIAIIAGSKQYVGAALLACKAALRTGSGLVYLLSTSYVGSIIQGQCPELIFLPLKENEDGFIDSSSSDLIEDYISRYKINVCCIGPGLGLNEGIKLLIRNCLNIFQNLNLPLVLDADALNAVSLSFLKKLKPSQLVLTPHAGEFKRLFLLESDLIFDHENRRNICFQQAQNLKQVIVLKGFKSVISDGKQTIVNMTGNTCLASAGTGDVLSGMIASLLGQGMGIFNASALATYLHGLAADIIQPEFDRSMLASDVIEAIPRAFIQLKRGFDE